MSNTTSNWESAWLGCICFVGGIIVGKLETVWHKTSGTEGHDRLPKPAGGVAPVAGDDDGSVVRTRYRPGHCLRLLAMRFVAFSVASRIALRGWSAWEFEASSLTSGKRLLACAGMIAPVVIHLFIIVWQVYAPVDFATRHHKILRLLLGSLTLVIIMQDQSGHPSLHKTYKSELLYGAIKLIIDQTHPVEFAAHLGLVTLTATTLHMLQLARNSDLQADLAAEGLYFMVAFPLLLCLQYTYLYLIGVDLTVLSPAVGDSVVTRVEGGAMLRPGHDSRDSTASRITEGGLVAARALPPRPGEAVPVAGPGPRDLAAYGGGHVHASALRRRPNGFPGQQKSASASAGGSAAVESTDGVADASRAVTRHPSACNLLEPLEFNGGDGESLLTSPDAPAAAPPPLPPSSSISHLPLLVRWFLRTLPTSVVLQWTGDAFLIFDRLVLIKLCIMRILGVVYLMLVGFERLRHSARLSNNGGGSGDSNSDSSVQLDDGSSCGGGTLVGGLGVTHDWWDILPTMVCLPIAIFANVINVIIPFKPHTLGLYVRHSGLVNNFAFYAQFLSCVIVLLTEPWHLQHHTVFRSACFLTMTLVVQEDYFLWFLTHEVLTIGVLLSIQAAHTPQYQGMHLIQVATALPEYIVVLLVGILLHFGTSRGKMVETSSDGRPAAAGSGGLLRIASFASLASAGMGRRPVGANLASRATTPGGSEKSCGIPRVPHDPQQLQILAAAAFASNSIPTSSAPGSDCSQVRASMAAGALRRGESAFANALPLQLPPKGSTAPGGNRASSASGTGGEDHSARLSLDHYVPHGIPLASGCRSISTALSERSAGGGTDALGGGSPFAAQALQFEATDGNGELLQQQQMRLTPAGSLSDGGACGSPPAAVAEPPPPLAVLRRPVGLMTVLAAAGGTWSAGWGALDALLHVLELLLVLTVEWVQRTLVRLTWPAAAAVHRLLLRRAPWLVEEWERCFSTPARRMSSYLVIWTVVVLIQQGTHTPWVLHTGSPFSKAPAPIPVLNEMAAPSTMVLMGAAWILLDLPRPPNPALLLLMPHRITLFYLHKCLWLHHCVGTWNTMLLASFKLQTMVAIGFALMSAFVHIVPVRLNTYAATLMVQGQPLNAPLRLALWLARTQRDAKRTGIVVVVWRGYSLLMNAIFCPMERERRRLSKEAAIMHLSDVVRQAVQRVRRGETLAPDAPLFPGITSGVTTGLLVALLVASALFIFRVLQIASRDVWYAKTKSTTVDTFPDLMPNCDAIALCDVMRDHFHELFHDMAVALYLAPPSSGDSSSTAPSLEGASVSTTLPGSMILVQHSRLLKDSLSSTLDEVVGCSLYHHVSNSSSPSKDSMWVENDLVTAVVGSHFAAAAQGPRQAASAQGGGASPVSMHVDGESAAAVLARLYAGLGASSLLVAPLGSTSGRGRACGCLILLSPCPDSYHVHYQQLVVDVERCISSALWPEPLPRLHPTSSCEIITPQAVGLIPATQLFGSNQISNHNLPSLMIDAGNLLGSGSFGKVFKGQYNNQPVAVKMIVHTSRSARLIENEVSLSKRLCHPHVLKTIDSISLRQHDSSHHHTASGSTPNQPAGGGGGLSRQQTNQSLAASSAVRAASLDDGTMNFSLSGSESLDGGGSGSYNMLADLDGSGTDNGMTDDHHTHQTWIVMEYMDRGTLAKALRQSAIEQPGQPDMTDVLLRAREIASGMAYLHSRNMIHGDLKSLNVLLATDATGPQGMIAKVADFGLSRHVAVGRSHLSTRTFGTLTHMPRELLMEGRLTDKVDIYSWGILLWELVCRGAPYAGLTHGEIIYRKVNLNEHPPLPAWLPAPVAELALSCWDQEPHRRPSFDDIVSRLDGFLAQADLCSEALQFGAAAAATATAAADAAITIRAEGAAGGVPAAACAAETASPLVAAGAATAAGRLSPATPPVSAAGSLGRGQGGVAASEVSPLLTPLCSEEPAVTDSSAAPSSCCSAELSLGTLLAPPNIYGVSEITAAELQSATCASLGPDPPLAGPSSCATPSQACSTSCAIAAGHGLLQPLQPAQAGGGGAHPTPRSRAKSLDWVNCRHVLALGCTIVGADGTTVATVQQTLSPVPSPSRGSTPVPSEDGPRDLVPALPPPAGGSSRCASGGNAEGVAAASGLTVAGTGGPPQGRPTSSVAPTASHQQRDGTDCSGFRAASPSTTSASDAADAPPATAAAAAAATPATAAAGAGDPPAQCSPAPPDHVATPPPAHVATSVADVTTGAAPGQMRGVAGGGGGDPAGPRASAAAATTLLHSD